MSSEHAGSRVRPTGLEVNDRAAPNNVPTDDPPRFSWRIDATGWGAEQSAYRILVARSRGALADREAMWDSGRVESSRSVNVPYEGPPPAPDATYYWAVEVWNEAGDTSGFSDPATFTTAPDGPWPGEWIGRCPDPGDTNGYRSRWYDDDSEQWVQVDLGELREFGRVDLHPAEPFDGPTTPDGQTITAYDTEESWAEATVVQGPVGFGFPRGYRVETADDPSFADATVLVDRTADGGTGDDGDEGDGSALTPPSEPVELDVDVEGRYVRVVATEPYTVDTGEERLREEQRPWNVFALAAIAVRDDGGADLARGCPVTASSSVEAETWGTSHLTNGAYESRIAASGGVLRREVELSKPVERARVHVAGLGYGELYVNGERVGDAVLDPGWTDYGERVLYSSYDLEDALGEGSNALGIRLGRGWFSKPVRHWTAFGSPRARLRMTVEYEDGTTREIATSGDWRAASGPILENDVYDGEVYDAREEHDGWAEPGFDDSEWADAAVLEGPGGDLEPQRAPPMRVTDVLEPEAIHDRPDGPIVDFGQNLTGWVELAVEGATEGQEIKVSHAETLLEDGSLNRIDLRTADATDTYVARGDGVETYEPRFTYHGFRYAQVSGYPRELDPGDVRAKVVHTDFESRGEFDCSNDDLVQVQHNARWGLRGNAHSIPTDCPQRDERQGFSGDGQLAAQALLYNFDAAGFHEKWLRDHADTQSRHGYLPTVFPHGSPPGVTDPTWTISWLVVPWYRYCHYGSDRALEAHYEGLCRYVDFWHSAAEDGLVPDRYSIFGDWVDLENADSPIGEPTELFTDAYHYRGTALMAEIADVLGYDGDATRYRDRAGRIAEAFNDRYFDAGRGVYEPVTQASNAVPLLFGLAPDGRGHDVAAALAERVEADGGKLRTGFLGTRALLFALTEYGYADLAYGVVSRREYPSWVYMARQGATTVWERWDSDDRVGDGMNSFNHSPFTYVSEWFYEALAGVRLDASLPQDRRVTVEPSFVEELDWASGRVETPFGEVGSRWERRDGGYDVTVEVPWNLTASARLPVDGDATVRIDDRLVWADGGPAGTGSVDAARRASPAADRVVVSLDPGTHDARIER